MHLLREIIIVGISATLIVLGTNYLQSKQAMGRQQQQTPSKPAAAIEMIFGSNSAAIPAHSAPTPLTVVLLLSPQCGFCEQSIPFYRTLGMEAGRKKVPLIVSVPVVAEAQKWLQDAGLGAAVVVPWRDLNVAVTGTPTLLALDSERRIRRIWRGWLNSRRQDSITSLIGDPGLLDKRPDVTATGEANLNNRDIEMLQQKAVPHAIIDVRERNSFATNHHVAAINIPLIELPTRVSHEVDATKLAIVDCSHLQIQDECQNAVDRLLEHGFSRVAALNEGFVVTNTCKITEAF